jgi:hypothetical protein
LTSDRCLGCSIPGNGENIIEDTCRASPFYHGNGLPPDPCVAHDEKRRRKRTQTRHGEQRVSLQRRHLESLAVSEYKARVLKNSQKTHSRGPSCPCIVPSINLFARAQLKELCIIVPLELPIQGSCSNYLLFAREGMVTIGLQKC